jgi:hypothetical protein
VRRPAAGWVGGVVALLGVAASLITARHMIATYPSTPFALTSFSRSVLVIALGLAVGLVLAAPRALTSSPFARYGGLGLGLLMGAGLLAASRLGALSEGAMLYVLPVQFLGFVVVPPIVAAITRSRRAGVQQIVWFAVFGAVVTFPVYIIEALRHHERGGGLFLDDDLPVLTSVATNFDNAVEWLFVVIPALFVPLGIVISLAAAAIARRIAAAWRRAD